MQITNRLQIKRNIVFILCELYELCRSYESKFNKVQIGFTPAPGFILNMVSIGLLLAPGSILSKGLDKVYTSSLFLIQQGNRSPIELNSGAYSEIFPLGKLNFFFQGGAQNPLGPKNPLKSIDFTGPDEGLAPIAPPLNTPLLEFLKRLIS